jgi:hypothetical protein
MYGNKNTTLVAPFCRITVGMLKKSSIREKMKLVELFLVSFLKRKYVPETSAKIEKL